MIIQQLNSNLVRYTIQKKAFYESVKLSLTIRQNAVRIYSGNGHIPTGKKYKK